MPTSELDAWLARAAGRRPLRLRHVASGSWKIEDRGVQPALLQRRHPDVETEYVVLAEVFRST